MTHTTLANLALDYLGEPYLTDYETDNGTTADAVRLHLPLAVAQTLSGHVWSFATRTSQLSEAGTVELTASITTGTDTDDNTIEWTAVAAGPSGNDIAVSISSQGGPAIVVTVTSTAIVITPVTYATVAGTITSDGSTPLAFPLLVHAGTYVSRDSFSATGNPVTEIEDDSVVCYYSGTYWDLVYRSGGTTVGRWKATATVASPDLVPAGEWHPTTNPQAWRPTAPATGTPVISLSYSSASTIAAAVTASTSASLLLSAVGMGAGAVESFLPTNLTGGASASAIYAPAWGSAFNLPSDCLRVIAVEDEDIDADRNRWDIQGRYLLLQEEEAEAPVVRYLTASPPVDEWPPDFADAVVLLLAARLAPKLTGNEQTAALLMQKHEAALGKARSRNTRETRSKENHGPRQLAARSGLVRARYGGFTPPY